MKKLSILTVAMIATLGLAACGKPEPVQKTADEQRAEALANSDKNAKLQTLLEQQRSVALANATSNAAAYFAANPRFDGSWKKMPHTDDQIGPACPQGSGWAWVNVMRVEGKNVEKIKLWCSTSSSSLNCYTEADFAKLPYAAQASKCDANLPYPLKVIGG